MRTGLVLGIFLGILLTVGAAYSFDAISGRIADGSSAAVADRRPVVNWDVVSRDLDELHAGLVQMGNRVQDGWKKLTG